MGGTPILPEGVPLGTPNPGQVPGQDAGVSPHQEGWGYPRPGLDGVPPSPGGMPLAFTQEDFLVTLIILKLLDMKPFVKTDRIKKRANYWLTFHIANYKARELPMDTNSKAGYSKLKIITKFHSNYGELDSQPLHNQLQSCQCSARYET